MLEDLMLEGSVQWDRLEGEPFPWFLRFQRYFLYRGLSRSIRRAWIAYLKENYPKRWEDLVLVSGSYNSWRKKAKEWHWQERANAWDVERNEEVRLVVLEAARFLKEHSMDAAEALLQALTNPRLTVAAANSMLDRAGLPATQRVESFEASAQMRADDLAELSQVVTEWREQTFKQSG